MDPKAVLEIYVAGNCNATVLRSPCGGGYCLVRTFVEKVVIRFPSAVERATTSWGPGNTHKGTCTAGTAITCRFSPAAENGQFQLVGTMRQYLPFEAILHTKLHATVTARGGRVITVSPFKFAGG